MRIISQDGTIDIPYDYFSLSVVSGRYEDIHYAAIYCHNLSSPSGTKLAEYSSAKKAEKAMEMLHEAYNGMPIVSKNVELDDTVKNIFSALDKTGIILKSFEDARQEVKCVNNIIFQFPKDDEVQEE